MSLVTNPQVLDRFDELLYNEPAAVLSDLMAVHLACGIGWDWCWFA